MSTFSVESNFSKMSLAITHFSDIGWHCLMLLACKRFSVTKG